MSTVKFYTEAELLEGGDEEATEQMKIQMEEELLREGAEEVPAVDAIAKRATNSEEPYSSDCSDLVFFDLDKQEYVYVEDMRPDESVTGRLSQLDINFEQKESETGEDWEMGQEEAEGMLFAPMTKEQWMLYGEGLQKPEDEEIPSQDPEVVDASSIVLVEDIAVNICPPPSHQDVRRCGLTPSPQGETLRKEDYEGEILVRISPNHAEGTPFSPVDFMSLEATVRLRKAQEETLQHALQGSLPPRPPLSGYRREEELNPPYSIPPPPHPSTGAVPALYSIMRLSPIPFYSSP